MKGPDRQIQPGETITDHLEDVPPIMTCFEDLDKFRRDNGIKTTRVHGVSVEYSKDSDGFSDAERGRVIQIRHLHFGRLPFNEPLQIK